MIHDLSVGRTVDRYQVERFLGRGGLATVVKVRHTLLGTTHAMKLLHASSPVLVERLLREGRVQARLRHPNLVAVTDVVPVGEEIALVMDYVAGPTLSRLLELTQLSLPERDLLAEQVMLGVKAAHAEGVIHRDLKPLNVLIAPEGDALVAKVADFGLARAIAAGADPRLTRSGASMGTPAYMAPEQHRSAEAADARADVFSLGVLLYELLTGRLPFHGIDAAALCAQAESRGYAPLAWAAPEAPARMLRAVEAALAPSPDERPQTVTDLLDLWRGGSPSPASPWQDQTLSAVHSWVKANNAPLHPMPTTAPLPPRDPAVSSLAEGPPRAAETSPLPAWNTPAGLTPAEPLPPPPPDPSRPLLMVGAGLTLLAGAGLALVIGSRSNHTPAAPTDSPPAQVEALRALPPSAGGDEGQAEAPPAEVTEAPPAQSADPPAPRRETSSSGVRVSGASSGYLLDSGGHRHGLSSALSPGLYQLFVSFGDEEAIQVMDLNLNLGEQRRIRCEPSLRKCK